MNQSQALVAFAALAHESLLEIVRMLVVAGANGISAGDIAVNLDASSPLRVSFNLKALEHAGSISRRRKGKLIIYTACWVDLADLVALLPSPVVACARILLHYLSPPRRSSYRFFPTASQRS